MASKILRRYYEDMSEKNAITIIKHIAKQINHSKAGNLAPPDIKKLF